MKILVYAFTDNGHKVADKIASIIEGTFVSASKVVSNDDFATNDALIFVGAVGIAIRQVAPFIEDKLTDPAVLVIDEKVRFVIPILSGHVGGANKLALKLAEELNAVPVITTATDVNNVIGIDELAKANSLKIYNRDNIKKVSGGLLKGMPKNIVFSDDVVISGDKSDVDEKVLGLIYEPIVVGLGMRKNKDYESLKRFFMETLEDYDLKPEDVNGLATIDIKKDEKALLELSEEFKIDIYFFSASELEGVTGEFEESDFVKKTVGVSDVSARAAKALGERGNFILKKKKQNGMTMSIFKKYRRVTFEY